MEGNTRWPGPRVAAALSAHPEVSIDPPVEGIWRATVNLDCGFGELWGLDEAELLAKLTAALGG
jgi:hypothetical protein